MDKLQATSQSGFSTARWETESTNMVVIINPVSICVFTYNGRPPR